MRAEKKEFKNFSEKYEFHLLLIFLFKEKLLKDHQSNGNFISLNTKKEKIKKKKKKTTTT